jgi:hypothetical protein
VHIYDLGALGNKFNKVTFLTVPEIAQGIYGRTGKQLDAKEMRI